MAYSIQVIRNHVRTELLKTGYAVSRPASSLQFASLQPYYDEISRSYVDRFQPCDEPALVWRELETGVIMLRPTGLRSDLYANPANASKWVPLSDLTYAANTLEEVVSNMPGEARRHWTMMPADGSGLSSISVPSLLSGRLPSDMAWVAKTTASLSADESFTVTVQPHGTADDRAEGLISIYWGGRHFIAFGQQGEAAYYSYVNSDWHLKQRFGWGSGMDLSAPVGFTIVPFGPQFLAIVAKGSGTSGADGSRLRKFLGLKERVENSILIRLADLQCQIDVGPGGEPVKCAQAPLYIAAPSQAMQIGFGIVRNRFEASSFYLCPEQLDGPKTLPAAPVSPIGYEWRSTSGSGSYTSDSGGTWDPDADTRLVPRITLNPDPSGVYTPELWGIEIDIPAATFTPAMTPIDCSAHWISINARLSVHPGSNEARVRVRRDSEYGSLLRPDATLRILQDGSVIFDGYVDRHNPVLRGFTQVAPKDDPLEENRLKHRAWIDDEIIAYDMWSRLDSTPAAYTLGFSRRTVGAMLDHLLRRAGFDSAQISIDPALNSISIDGWDSDNVWKGAVADASAGDLIRSLIDQFGVQQAGDIRVKWNGSQWICGFRSSSDPSLCFVLDRTVFPDQADADRWTSGRLYVLSDPEFHIRRMAFNSLMVLAQSSDGSTLGSFAASVSPHPSALTDETSAVFDGRLIPAVMAPGANPLASTFEGCVKAARRAWDKEYQQTRLVSFDAEFRTALAAPDKVAWIAGRSPVTLESLGIEAGDPVSLGKWLIEEIQVEIVSDDDPSASGRKTAGRAFHSGNYTLSYLGPYSETGFPMFTDVLPEP